MDPSRWSPYDQQYSQLSGGSPHLPPSAPPEESVSFAGTNSDPLLMSSCQGLPVSRTNSDPSSAPAGLSNSNYDGLIPQPIQSSKESEFYDETLYNGGIDKHNFLQAQGSASRNESFPPENMPGYTGQVSSQPFHSSNVELPVSGSFGVLPHESVKNHPGRFERNNNEKYISKQPPVSYNNGPYTDRDVSGIYSSAPLSAQSAFSGDTASLSPVVNSVTSPSLSNFSSPSEYYSSPKTSFGAYNSLQSPVPLSPSVAQSYPSSPYTNVDPVGHISTAPPCSPMSGGTYVNNMNVVPQRNGQKSQHSPNALCYSAPQSQNIGYHGPPSVLPKTPDYHSDYVFAPDHNSPSYSSVYPAMHPGQMSAGSNSRISPRTHTPHSNSVSHDGRMSYGHSNTMTPTPISSPTYLQNKVNHETSYGTCPSNISPGQSMHPPRYPPTINPLRNNMHPNSSMMPDHISSDRQFNFSSDIVDDKNALDMFNSHVDSGIHNQDAMSSITPFLENDLRIIDGDMLTAGRHLRSSESEMHQNSTMNMENSNRIGLSRPPVSKDLQKEMRSHGTPNYSYNSSHLDPVRPGNFSLNGPRRRGRRGRRRKVGISGNMTRFHSYKNDCNMYSNGYPVQSSGMLDTYNPDCYNAFDNRLYDEKLPLNYPISKYRPELRMAENQKRPAILTKPIRKFVSIEDELSFLGNLKFPVTPLTTIHQRVTRSKDTEGYLSSYKKFLASRKSSSDTECGSSAAYVSKSNSSNIKNNKNKIDNKDNKDHQNSCDNDCKDHLNNSDSKNKKNDGESKSDRPPLPIVLHLQNNTWRFKSPPQVTDDGSASASSEDLSVSSHSIKRENDAEENSKRLKKTGKLNKVSERYSKHSANQKRTDNSIIKMNDTNSETLLAGENRVKPELESLSAECDIQSNAPKKRGRKVKKSHHGKAESKKRETSLKTTEASTSEATFSPVKIKQEILEEDEVPHDGTRRSLRRRRSDRTSQEIASESSVKQERTDDNTEHIDISSDDVDTIDDTDSDPTWDETGKGGDGKSQIHMIPRKRAPKIRHRNSSGSSAAARKKEKSGVSRKRNASSSHRTSAKKQNALPPDPNVKIKKEKERFLVAKTDLEKKTPFIWRVDKETNMLQRFEWYEQQGITLYRSTYTYAAWNENSFSNYVTANVKIVSHSRILYVVEYLGPDLAELAELEKEKNLAAGESSNSPLRDNFEVYLQSLISQALDPNFLTEITNENDEYFLNSIKEIEDITDGKKKNLIRDFWNDDLFKSVNTYPSLESQSITSENEECEVCKQENAVKSLQFQGEPYDIITLQPLEAFSQYKSQYNVCDTCCTFLSLYGQLQHQKYYFYIKCRTKMNDVKSTSDKVESHFLLEECLQDHKWVNALFEELELVWKQCDEKS